MATAKYEVLIPEVSVQAVNCPEPLIINALRNACIEFCRETLYLTQDLDPIFVTAGEATYTVDAVSGFDVVQVLEPLYFSGNRLHTFTQLGIQSVSDWQSHTAEKPWAYTCLNPAEITLYPKPTVDVAAAITGRIALAPSRSSTSTDAGLLADFRTELAAGALAQVLAVPDQPYTDQNRALLYKRLFDASKVNAANSVRSAHMNAPLRVQFPRF